MPDVVVRAAERVSSHRPRSVAQTLTYSRAQKPQTKDRKSLSKKPTADDEEPAGTDDEVGETAEDALEEKIGEMVRKKLEAHKLAMANRYVSLRQARTHA